MEWVRGETIGHGSFSTVSLAKPTNSDVLFPPLIAVKSSAFLLSATLQHEMQVLDELGSCPQIIRCFGDDRRGADGEEVYSLFLEYASRGSLADRVRNCGGRGLPESDVRRFTRDILKGLCHIHEKGFAHCDLKLENLLISSNGDVKIADFGLAKKKTEQKQGKLAGQEYGESRVEMRGTPLYMAPESVNDNVYESPADIWALGCAVVEMASGKTAWSFEKGYNLMSLLVRIGVGDETPVIPVELSEEAKEFLSKCFFKDPKKRWTAEMLLSHPFVAVDCIPSSCSIEDDVSTSPRSPFDFPEWISDNVSVKESVDCVYLFDAPLDLSSPEERIRRLVTGEGPDWSVSQNWVTVR